MVKKKKSILSKCGESLVQAARKMAVIQANTACTFLSYQPKEPDALKNLRKF